MARQKTDGIPQMTRAEMKRHLEWQAQDDMRTLRAAEEIRADKQRHGRATAQAKKEVAQLSKIANSGTRRGGKR